RLFEVRACGFPQALTLIGCSFVKELSGPAGAASCSEVANYTHLSSTRQHPTPQKYSFLKTEKNPAQAVSHVTGPKDFRRHSNTAKYCKFSPDDGGQAVKNLWITIKSPA
ncbi:hypothetical protein LH427_16240, partial [Laribacter hongkongensis]